MDADEAFAGRPVPPPAEPAPIAESEAMARVPREQLWRALEAARTLARACQGRLDSQRFADGLEALEDRLAELPLPKIRPR